jgi:hypothetical protein
MTREDDKLTTADMAYGTQERGGDGSEGAVREIRRDDAMTEEHGTEPLLPENTSADYRQRWDSIQARFVDEPRASVEEADTLVAEVIQQLAQKFADARQNLESQWDRGDDVSTEDLRLALQQYRTFFQRLLSA